MLYSFYGLVINNYQQRGGVMAKQPKEVDSFIEEIHEASLNNEEFSNWLDKNPHATLTIKITATQVTTELENVA